MERDYERLAVDYLNASGVGARAYYDVPAERPREFVTVLLTGLTTSNLVMAQPRISADCWARDRRSAHSLALSVRDAVLSMPDRLDNVFGTRVTALYRNPDPDSGSPRYTVSFELDVCE